MLVFASESSNKPINANFDIMVENDKYVEICNRLMKFVNTFKIGDAESLGDGFLIKSPNYTVVMFDGVIRINYYPTKAPIFQFLTINLNEGEASHNIEKWPAELMQLYKDILDIANS